MHCGRGRLGALFCRGGARAVKKPRKKNKPKPKKAAARGGANRAGQFAKSARTATAPSARVKTSRHATPVASVRQAILPALGPERTGIAVLMAPMLLLATMLWATNVMRSPTTRLPAIGSDRSDAVRLTSRAVAPLAPSSDQARVPGAAASSRSGETSRPAPAIAEPVPNQREAGLATPAAAPEMRPLLPVAPREVADGTLGVGSSMPGSYELDLQTSIDQRAAAEAERAAIQISAAAVPPELEAAPIETLETLVGGTLVPGSTPDPGALALREETDRGRAPPAEIPIPVALAPPAPIADEARQASLPATESVCPAPAGLSFAAKRVPKPVMPAPPADDDASFGLRLAVAAAAQVGDVTIYTPRYQRIAYPMGDVSPLYGVCTDVVIRAYRALGIDLQELVQISRGGRGDPSIDHRRTETLRRFLAAHGQSIPVSDFAENFKPGDIVTYHRPQNRSSTAHIAIVSDRIAPSGRPYIIHNRGWGVQFEDALFVDRITGHYRFRTLPPGDGAPGPATAELAPRRDLCLATLPAHARSRTARLCAQRVAGTGLVK